MGKMGTKFLSRFIAIGRGLIDLNQRADLDKNFEKIFTMRKLEKVAQGGGRYPIPGNSQGQVG